MFHRLAIGITLLSVIISSLVAARAQDSTSKLVLFSTDPFKNNETVIFTNEDGKDLHRIKWPSGLPLYR
jgi:hypothetical protein